MVLISRYNQTSLSEHLYDTWAERVKIHMISTSAKYRHLRNTDMQFFPFGLRIIGVTDCTTQVNGAFPLIGYSNSGHQDVVWSPQGKQNGFARIFFAHL